MRAFPAAASLSVVISVHDEVRSLPVLYQELTGVLDGLDRAAEIVVVDDGSTDGSDPVVRQLATRDGRVRLVRLRRRAGLTAALDAGFAAARGAVVVVATVGPVYPLRYYWKHQVEDIASVGFPGPPRAGIERS